MDLFTYAESYPFAAGHRGTDTSREAAERISARNLRARVLETIRKHGPLTADECARTLCRSILSIRPRCTELRELGKLRDTGERRLNSSGRRAIVWATNQRTGCLIAEIETGV